jgi:hypothetical protein
MSRFTTLRCPLCDGEGIAVSVAEVSAMVDATYPVEPGAIVQNARDFRVGDSALLHHECPSRQLDDDSPWWDSVRAWWACQEPARSLDSDAHFDLNCEECAARWAARQPD